MKWCGRRNIPSYQWTAGVAMASSVSFRLGVRPSRDGVRERPLVVDRYVHPRDRVSRGHPGEELLRHLGQERAGQDVVDVPRPALDLLAAAGDVRHEVVAV